MQYHNIDRCLIGEIYLENQEEDLYDYKVWCFNGRAEFIEVIKGRNKKMTMDFYDRDWRLLPFTYGYPNNDVPSPCPDNLDDMIAKAEALAADFPHVRVDFYRCNNGKLYFGELTFTSASGICEWSIPDYDEKIGSLFSYPGMPR